MKFYGILIGLVMFVLLFSITKANEIDGIKSDEDVNHFMIENFQENFRQFKVADTNYIWDEYSIKTLYKLIADTLGMKFWYKADFNRDSLTDLLVFGSYIKGKSEPTDKYTGVFCILDSDSGKYQIIQLPRNLGLPFPIIVQNQFASLILFYQTVEDNFEYKDDPRYNYLGVKDTDVLLAYIRDKPYVCVDTLIYKFGTFIEYNSNPQPKEIEEIYVENYCGMLACYVMKLTVKDDGRATMIGGEYYEDKKKYFTKINPQQINEIIELINYLDFDKLASGYSSWITDDSAVELKIEYDDKVKEIYDYGNSSTLALKKLFQMLFGLRHNQDWRRIYR